MSTLQYIPGRVAAGKKAYKPPLYIPSVQSPPPPLYLPTVPNLSSLLTVSWPYSILRSKQVWEFSKHMLLKQFVWIHETASMQAQKSAD